ncbi:MAG: sensor domain-containing diguanylate cyclase [Candidatus Omnitrophica bacterium]|nr:sensor domain-containing diguanylate cyclase [Candidatus Omnitrophota bacterium]MDD5553899.1 sensor domain-containing diguanylate cyclase [Candidatus Omnitrophota bacterium]
MDEVGKIKQELERTKTELAILYEISNAMRTTLRLEEILYIILTGVTAHIGLGFNRALLFLVNEKENLIEGKMGIGPESGEEANLIWTRVEQEQMDMDDLISAYKAKGDIPDTRFNQQVRRVKIPVKDQSGGLLALGVLDGMPLLLTKETIQSYAHDPIIQLLKSDELVVAPLKAKDKVNGIILADNFITRKPITKDDIRMLIMLANQAGLAIENSQLYEKAVTRAHSDSLTELWNHGYFQYLLQSELEKAKVTKKPLTLIMIDIDNFKVYNDALGHQSGDKILKALATLIKNQSRKMDYVCRYGGEEFTVILPQTDKKESFLIAERLRSDIEKFPFLNEEMLPDNKLTVSIGISSYPEDCLTPADLVSLTDKALYTAKQKGKNNTCCCPAAA